MSRLHPDDDQRPDRPLTLREKFIGGGLVLAAIGITVAAVVLVLRWLFGG